MRKNIKNPEDFCMVGKLKFLDQNKTKNKKSLLVFVFIFVDNYDFLVIINIFYYILKML